MWNVVRQDFVAINQAAASIKLRLNPKEAGATKVLASIEVLEKLFAKGKRVDNEILKDAESTLITESQIVLKQEWVRVRRGERVYRIAKFATSAVVIACVGYLVVTAASHLPLMR